MLHNPPTCICFCFDWWRAAFKMASISDSGLNGSALSKILLSHIFYTIWDRPDKSWELCRLSFSGWSIGFKDRFFHRDERWENLPKILFSLTAMQRSICYQPWAPKQALYIRLPSANINISHMHDKGPNRVTSLNESIYFTRVKILQGDNMRQTSELYLNKGAHIAFKLNANKHIPNKL